MQSQKNCVEDEFPTKQDVLGGVTMSGSLNLGGNEIYGIVLTPNVNSSAMSEKYVNNEISNLSYTEDYCIGSSNE
jgi:hypothetical protein